MTTEEAIEQMQNIIDQLEGNPEKEALMIRAGLLTLLGAITGPADGLMHYNAVMQSFIKARRAKFYGSLN